MKPTKSELLKAIILNESLELGGVILVVAGVVFDALLSVLDAHVPTSIKPIGPGIANGLVALGVVIEVWFGRRAGSLREGLQKQAERRVVRLKRETEELRLARAKIEERLAPRTIPEEKLSEVIAEISAFKGQRVFLTVAPSTSETEVFARFLGYMFERAEWVLAGFSSSPKPAVIIPSGVIVQWYCPEATPRLASMTLPDATPSIALSEALNKVGITATAFPGPIQSLGAITVIVSTKE